MAYDEALAARVRDRVAGEAGLQERQMFGGLGFLLDGNMAVGVMREELLVRLDPDDAADAIAQPGVRPMEMGGRQSKGWVLVAVESDDELAGWVRKGVAFARSLPPKR